MQQFIAELSKVIDQAEFEKYWRCYSVTNPGFTVGFGFTGRRISIRIESSQPERWGSENFRRIFSRAVREVDRECNVRWI